jgi:hypothetical protein
MGKVVELPNSSVRDQRFYVAWSNPAAAQWSRFDIAPTTDILVQRGYYKPSRVRGVWTFVGDYKADPWVSFDRRYKKWKREVNRLSKDGVFADTVIPPRPIPPGRNP